VSTQYRCTNSVRRVLIRDTKGANGKPIVNGIDYLEVDPLDQRKLLVHFIHPLPGQPNGVPAGPALTTDNFTIEGGVRLTDIAVVGAPVASGQVLTVTVNAAGDFSTYTLRLVLPATAEGAPPPGFDPQLAEVPFSFKVNCENDFDCQPEQVCPEPSLPEPLISYLAKDYSSFRRLLLDRLAVTMPDWQERNPADLGVVLAELLAYAGDYLSYYQDAVATEAYLGTARRRASVRRHARLVDYHMHDGANARAWICFEVDGDLLGTPDQPALRAGSAIVSGTDLPTVFETLHPIVSLRAKRNAIAFYTWGDHDCCLPKGATRAYLTGSAADLDLAKGDVLIFEERLGPESGRPEDADPAHRHAVRLSEDPREQTDPLTQQSVLEIQWYAEDALPFPLCLREFTDSTNQIIMSSVACGNVALADHGRTVSEDGAGGALVPASVPAGNPYLPRLETDEGLTQAMPYDDGTARAGPAVAALRLDLQQVLPSVTLRAEGTLWRPKRDLLNSGRFAPEFVVETEDDGQAALRFGDDTLGRRPAQGTTFRATYRVGNGPAGNVGAEALDTLAAGPISGIKKVRNPMPAVGGTAPEPTDQVRLYAPQSFRTQERAVTEADYAAAAERHDDVQRAAATRRWTGSWYTMFVTVDRRGGRPVDAGFEEELRQWLERFRLAGYDVEIDGPLYVPLDLALTVCAAPGYFRSSVKEALLDAFSTSDLPDGQRGFFHPDNFTFGQPVYLSRIIATAMQVQGVQWVDAEEGPDKPNRFRRFGQDSHGEAAAGVIELGRLEIARLDNDPSAPENGRLDFIMMGGI
jgi:hypothetical protein